MAEVGKPHLRWALETGLSVAFARAFTSSSFHTLSRDDYRPTEESLAWISTTISSRSRDSRYAHTEKDSGRSASFITTVGKGIGWSRNLFPDERLAEAVTLCESQRHRFEREARELRVRLDSD